MLARSRMQLRLLLFMAMSVIAFAVPATALAVDDIYVSGGYTDADDAFVVDFDNEVNGASYAEGDPIAFRAVIFNDGPDTTTGLGFFVNFPVAYVDPASLSVEYVSGFAAAPVCTVPNPEFPELECSFAAQLPINESTKIQINATTLDNSYEANDLQSPFRVSTDSSFDEGTETTDIRDLEDPTCANQGYFYDSTFTRAELQDDGTISIPIDCTDPDGDALTITPKAGTNGTVTGSGTSATFTASPATLANPDGFFEFFEVSLADDEGSTTTANILVAVYTQSNTSSTITGPADVAVAAAGSNVTYTNTVRNAGPDARGRVSFGWEISDKATIVGATANGAAVTCESAGYGDPGLVAIGCGSASMPAIGASVSATITLRYAEGEKGLKLPASAKVTAIAGPDSTSGAEDRTYADNESGITAKLTQAPAPANPTQGTAGNDRLVGTSGNDTYSGGAGSDTFLGAAGNDTFYGEAGDDVFDGGAGDDRFYGGTGDDSGFGGLGTDTLFGGLGNDRLVGGDGADKLLGQDGRDRLLGSTGADLVNGGTGNDVVRGGTGADRVFCGTGTDVATGDNGMDLIGCRDGKPGDTLSGGFGFDVCVGDRGDRFLSCETIVRV